MDLVAASGILLDGVRPRRCSPVDPLTCGTRAARGGRAGRDEKILQAGVRVGGGDPEQDYLADGMVEEIITALFHKGQSQTQRFR